MTVDDAIKAFAAIEGLNDGTKASAARIRRLKRVLLRTPEIFWETFLGTVLADSPLSVKAEALLRSGAVDDTTTFADLPGILAVEAMDEKFNRERHGAK